MKRYIGALTLVLISITQVAWAPYLLIFGFVFPLFILAVWLVYPYIAHRHLIGMVVLGGLLLDGMSPYMFGLNTLACVWALLSIHLLEKYAITNRVVARIVSLVVSIAIYTFIMSQGVLL